MNPEELMPPEEPMPEEMPPEEMTDPELAPEQFEMQQGMEGMPEGEYDEMGAMGNAPADTMMGDKPEPEEMLAEVAMSYMNWTQGIIDDKSLDKQVQSQILVGMAQSISSLVQLLQNDKEAEIQLKREEHMMNMEMKQKELEFKQQEHEMKLSHSQAENQLKLQHTQQSNQQQLQQQQENHQHSIVQSQESHGQKMEQGKQAAQLKQSSKQGSEGGK